MDKIVMKKIKVCSLFVSIRTIAMIKKIHLYLNYTIAILESYKFRYKLKRTRKLPVSTDILQYTEFAPFEA